jgi:glycosyltransferase involved in cell wall biosynthesis
VLATDCPFGPAEIIATGENGWLVKPGDATALADGILAALGDPQRRAQVAAAGQQHARNFASATIAAQYARELVALCASGTAASRA